MSGSHAACAAARSVACGLFTFHLIFAAFALSIAAQTVSLERGAEGSNKPRRVIETTPPDAAQTILAPLAADFTDAPQVVYVTEDASGINFNGN